MSHVPTVLKSDRSVFDQMLPVDDNGVKPDIHCHQPEAFYQILIVSHMRRQWPDIRGRLDLAVLFTSSTPNRQNRNQVRWNTCAGVLRSTPSSKVVQTEQSRDLFRNKMAEHCLHCTEIFFSLSR